MHTVCVRNMQVFLNFRFVFCNEMCELMVSLMHHTEVQQRIPKLINHINGRA